MRIRLTAATMLALTATALTAPAAQAYDRDCGDFPSQKAAQIFFLNNNPGADPHRLDADGDWVVCESNPGPYYYGKDPNPDAPDPKPTPTPTPAPKPQPLKVVRVIDGKLVKVRQGVQKPYVVHLLGVAIPGNSCKAKAARQDLRSWIKPGRVVRISVDKRAPKRDKQGRRLLNLVTVKGNFTIGGSQIATGYAKVDRSIRFKDKGRYLKAERKAEKKVLGYHESCS